MTSSVGSDPPAFSTITAPWLATLAACAGSIYALHQLGNVEGFGVPWSDLWGWLGSHGPEVVLMAFARVAGLVLAYWIAASLVVSTAAHASRIPALIVSVEWLTLPAIRRLAERSVAMSLSVASVTAVAFGPALVSLPEDEAPRAVAMAYDGGGTGVAEYVPVPAGDEIFRSIDEQLPAPEAAGSPATGTEADDGPVSAPDASYVPIPAGAHVEIPLAPTARFNEAPPRLIHPASADPSAAAARAADQAFEHSVVRGDNLWTIAEEHLSTVLDRVPTNPETATYWSHLIEVNRQRLKSGNPDLIFPGEVVVCPPAADVGIGN